MHNGGIAAWPLVKRPLALGLGEKWFLGVQGGTDSEWAFALFLDCLERAGVDPDQLAEGAAEGETAAAGPGFGHAVLRAAMLATIERINALVAAVPDAKLAALDDAAEAEGGRRMARRSLLNFAVTDGHSVICTRYVGSRTDEAASLYFSSGTSWRDEGGGHFVMERRDRGADIVLVASEPLTFERDNWVTVPTNSVLTIHRQTVMVHPILDAFYNASPSFVRRGEFAESMGLVSHAPGAVAELEVAA